MSEYIKYDEMYNKALNKYRKFANGEPVYNITKQSDSNGILDANNILIITDANLSEKAKDKIKEEKEHEIDANNDINYTCYHSKLHKEFSIKGNDLKKAKDKQALEVMKKYDKSQLCKDIIPCIIVGILTFILGIMLTFFVMIILFNRESDLTIFSSWIKFGILSFIISFIMTTTFIFQIYLDTKKQKILRSESMKI